MKRKAFGTSFLYWVDFTNEVTNKVKVCTAFWKKGLTRFLIFPGQFRINVTKYFLTFPACLGSQRFFLVWVYNHSNLLNMQNLQEQVKKAFCYQKLFWLFIIWVNYADFADSQPSASNFKSFSWSLEYFFLTVRQNSFGNKIPFLSILILFRP